MSNIQVRRDFPGRTAKECYNACIEALHEANFKIFKQRDYAWFVIASQTIDDKEFSCNIFASTGTSALVELHMSASDLSTTQLDSQASKLLGLIQKRLD